MSLGDTFGEHIHFEKANHATRSRPSAQSPGFQWGGTILLLFVTAIFIIIFARVVKLQLFEGAYFNNLSNNNRTAVLTIHAPRGSIYDRNGVLIAGSDGAFRLRQCDEKNQCTAKVISRDDGINLEAKGLSRGQSLEVDAQRFYPKAEATSHVLGYVSEITAEELAKMSQYNLGDRIGRSGIEQQYEPTLRGEDGREIVEVDATGQKVRSLGIEPAKSGQNITLTIDAGLQKTALEALGGKKGAAVVSDPQTGEILALVSSPAFDDNAFTSLIMSNDERDKMLESIFTNPDLPMFNRAISATYPPGSTFKIVTATAGLETGKITADTTIDDPGILVIGPYKFPNWKYLRDGGTQGVLNVVSAIQKSNDIFFYRVGEWVGEKDLFSWAEKLGLSHTLGIDLPGEAPGLIPNESWRVENNRTWYLGDTYHAAIGQGDVLVTPLQDNFWTDIIANGGKLCTPHLVKKNQSAAKNDQCRNLGLKKDTVNLVQQGMVAACSPGGTAYPLFAFQVKGKPIQIACKTGTAEFGNADETHAWLTSYAPAEKPEIAVTVILEGAGEGSDVAAPAVKKIMEAWFGR